MSAELEKLAGYYKERGNQPRAALYAALATEERAIDGPETVADKKVINSDPTIQYLIDLTTEIARNNPKNQLSLLIQMNLFKLRKSQTWLAGKLNIHPESLSRIVKASKNTSAATVLSIGGIFNIPLSASHSLASKIRGQ